MTAIVVSLLCVPAATAEPAAELKCPPNTKPVRSGCIPKSAAHVKRGEKCLSARLAVVHYRGKTWERQLARGGTLADATPVVRGKTCRWARYAAREWQARAKAAQEALERWERERMLHDPPFCDGCRAWHKAVERVQRVFPGTSGWLLSCSAAEGGHGRWVVYGGRSYWSGAEYARTFHGWMVGGPMQYMWPTFKGHYRHGLAYVRSKGFRVPDHLKDTGDVRTWRSALGQAIAAGWARYTGNDDAHWSASWGRGC